MLISEREACAHLSSIGLTRRSARRVLASGLAGDPMRTRSALLFDEARVQQLTARRETSLVEVLDISPSHSLFVARRDVTVSSPREEQLAVLSGGWSAVSPWRWVTMGIQIQRCGPIPFVATVSGFVVLGADIVALRAGSRLVLDEPGSWFDSVSGARLPTGPGRPWVLYLGPWSRASEVPEHPASRPNLRAAN